MSSTWLLPEGSAAILPLGLLLGLAVGASAQVSRFCTLGAIADALERHDTRRLRAWVLAGAVAIAGSQLLHGLALVDLSRSAYLRPTLALPTALGGGILFGIGMAMAGGCGLRTLVRVGSGSLKALVVALALAVGAFIAMSGLLAQPRLGLDAWLSIDLTALGLTSSGLVELAASVAGVTPTTASSILAFLVAGGMSAWSLSSPAFAGSLRHVGSGVAIGIAIPTGWLITGVAGADVFDPVPLQSLSFVAPIGDTLMYAMTASGASVDFGIATVAGVVMGAFGAARTYGELRMDNFTSPLDFRRHLLGGLLMGIGGVSAAGCTIGQALTGLSTLSLSSFLVVPAIGFGTVVALKRLQEKRTCA